MYERNNYIIPYNAYKNLELCESCLYQIKIKLKEALILISKENNNTFLTCELEN